MPRKARCSNRAPHSDPYSSTRLVQEFAGQQNRAETRMKQAGQLKCRAIRSVEVHRNGHRVRFADKTYDGLTPGRVTDGAGRKPKGRYFSGGKYHQESIAVQP